MWCVAHEILLSPSFYHVFVSPHMSRMCCTHMCTHTHRGKVPTESREESKRRPCPLQTSGSSFSSCFSPNSSRLCSFFFVLSFFFCLSLLLSPIGPSSGSFDWRARAGGGRREEEKKRRRERDRIKEKEREKARREGERRTGPPRSRRSPGRSFLPRHRTKRITREKKGNGSFVEDQRIYRGSFCS